MSDLLGIVAHEFARHRTLAERALVALDDERFFRRPAPAVNSLALIVKHLAGNLRSRWSDPFSGDGDRPDRDRDAEFVRVPEDSRDSLMAAWAEGWSTLERTLALLRPADLERRITIRGEAHTVAQALLRGLTHAAYHAGQVLYVARMLAPDAPWLTIAPGASGSTRGAYLAPPSLRPRRVLETALYVVDLGRAATFYESVLGLSVMGRSDRMVSLDAGRATVLLLFRRGASLNGIATEGGRFPRTTAPDRCTSPLR